MSISSIFILEATPALANAMIGEYINTTTIDINLPYDAEERILSVRETESGQEEDIYIPAAEGGDYSIEMQHWWQIEPAYFSIRIKVSGTSLDLSGTVTRIAFNEGGDMPGGGQPT